MIFGLHHTRLRNWSHQFLEDSGSLGSAITIHVDNMLRAKNAFTYRLGQNYMDTPLLVCSNTIIRSQFTNYQYC